MALTRNQAIRAIASNRAMADRLASPEVPKSLIEWLEREFPPRCLGTAETVEDHLRYAGKVELVQSLRDRFNDQPDWNDASDLDGFGAEEMEHL